LAAVASVLAVLPQARPGLVFGDVVYFRLAAAPTVEFAAAVVATDGSRCLLAMPDAFW
jgi:hypothetical protein